ncbi:MAG: HupE/UreJ family protein [Xanthobacteraceae bacterium]
MDSGELAQGLFLGLLSPLLAPAHLLSVVGLGLLAGRARAAIPLAIFAIAFAAGLAALAAAVGATPARNVLLGASALNGLAVALAVAVPRAVIALLAGVTGVALGLDSPPETVSLAVGNAMLLGNWLGGCLLVAVVAGFASRLARPWQLVALRVLGSWAAAAAILALALRLFR